MRALSFTGCVPVGEGIRETAGRLGKRVQLELGGHNPLIVMADADLDARRRGGLRGRVLVGGPEVHGDAADLRAGRRVRRVPRRLPRADGARTRRRPGRPGHRGRAARQRERDGRRPGRDRARALRGRHRCSPAASAATTRRLPRGADRVRGRRRRRERSPARRCSARSPRSTASGISTRRSRARTRSSSASRRRSSPTSLAATQQFVDAGRGGHPPRQLPDRRRRRPRALRRRQGLGFGPHEQGRAAREFYTEVVTVYQDA